MQSEYDILQENKTWTLVDRPNDRNVLTNRWEFKTKIGQNNEIVKYKARLVACGYSQERGIDYEEVFAPVARYETIRTLLALCVNGEMHIHQMDVIAAYVQGQLHDELFIEQPELFIQSGEENKVCKLLKPLYGLKQFGREWYKELDGFIQKNGDKRNPVDPCVYVFGSGMNRVILIAYVDDLLLASKSIERLNVVKSMLKSKFKITDLGQLKNLLGINIQREGQTGKIRLSQKQYVEKLLKKFNMEDSKEVSTPMESSLKISKKMSSTTEEEKSEMKNRPYRELVGGLIYLANATRPDIAFAAAVLSRFCSNPGRNHWFIAKRVLRYLKATLNYGITYVKDSKNLIAYSDSDWAGDIDDRKSCSGNVLMLSGGPISWKSKKQCSVALSTMEAEYAALSEVSREIVYIKRLMIHMGFEMYVKSPINVFCDNQSAIELSKDAVLHKRSKHIDISYHFTRELVDNKDILISYVQTNLMLADILTKALTKCKHIENVKMLQLN